ncbi:MAG: peptidase MA family metallohydrolase [Polyangiales bacterium]
MRWGTFGFSIALLSLPSPSARAQLPASAQAQLQASAQALAALRIETAAAALQPLLPTHAAQPAVAFQRAMLAFYRGDYAQAVTWAKPLHRDASLPDLWRQMQQLWRATRDAVLDFEQYRSRDGRYWLRYAPGVDRVLVPYALDVLRRADAMLARTLGHQLPGPIRVEIYPSAAVLAQVSSLSEADIERTGTIALCKWNRLMLTSPRALLHGYPWRDTLAHELTHLVLSRATADKSPVWLQEGVAKLLERRWRTQPGALIEAGAWRLLQQAEAKQRLIPFRKLHPSIARLPSQRDAALAFAQVVTLMDVFVELGGPSALPQLVRRVHAGQDAQKAMAAISGLGWSALLARWRAHIRAHPSGGADASVPERRLLRGGDPLNAERQAVQAASAQRWLRLGDLLTARGHAPAAALEYAKAYRSVPADPTVASRYAATLLDRKQAAQALSVMQRARLHRPKHAPLLALTGLSQLALGQTKAARISLRQSLERNPFDPSVHCGLAQVVGTPAARAREQRYCHMLQRK